MLATLIREKHEKNYHSVDGDWDAYINNRFGNQSIDWELSTMKGKLENLFYDLDLEKGK